MCSNVLMRKTRYNLHSQGLAGVIVIESREFEGGLVGRDLLKLRLGHAGEPEILGQGFLVVQKVLLELVPQRRDCFYVMLISNVLD